ncbi:MAG: EAL domain-containing protein, partial [Gammaproteobacteria bacterium]|nr:EAL domain-containing protein [Gammaproteobacteria bacterium]
MKFKPRKGTHRVKELRFAAEKVTMETHTPDQTPQSVAQPQDTVTTVATPLKEIFIGRQPIYNANLGVHAYELLFRADNITIQDMDKDVATAEVVLHAFFEFGIEKLVGGRHVTVNVTERFLKRLMDVHTLPIPPEFLILDIPPDMNPNEEMMNLLRDLVSKGITLALDDFLYRKQADELLGLAKQVKFEVGELTEKQLKILISKFKKIDVPIVAKRVENLEEYMRLRDLGIDYFQGNLLGSPRVFKTKTLPPDRLSVIRLLSTLMDASTETEQINEVLSQNVQLSYKLLKVINSAFYGL